MFRWTPIRSQAPSTNPIEVRFVDAQRPLVNGSMTFTAYVNDYVEVSAGSTVMLAGETNGVPPHCFLQRGTARPAIPSRAPQRYCGWSRLFPEIASASMQTSSTNTIALTFTVMPGQTLQGTQHLARLHFSAVPGQNSGFAPLRLDSMSAEVTAATSVEPTLLVSDGRAVVVGTQPLVEARYRTAMQREVTVYRRRNTAYAIEVSTNLINGGTWRSRGTVSGASMSNLTQSLILNTPVPPVFWRAKQQ